MIEVTPVCGKIYLGKQGENLARVVCFEEPAEWKKLFGEGVCELVHQRKGDDELYPVLLNIENNKVCWRVTESDTARVGEGQCELHYRVNGVVLKSKIWTTTVLPSLGDATAEPPQPEKTWVDQVLEAADDVRNATVHPPIIGENGNWWLWDFEASEYKDSGMSSESDITDVDTINANIINTDIINLKKANMIEKIVLNGVYGKPMLGLFDVIISNPSESRSLDFKSENYFELRGLPNRQDSLYIQKDKIVYNKKIREIKLGSDVDYSAWFQTSDDNNKPEKLFYLNLNDAVYKNGKALLTDEELEMLNRGECCFYLGVGNAELGGYNPQAGWYDTLTEDSFMVLFQQTNKNYLRLYIKDSDLSDIRKAQAGYVPIPPKEMPEGSNDIRTKEMTLYIATKIPTVTEESHPEFESTWWGDFIENYNKNSVIKCQCEDIETVNLIMVIAEVKYGSILGYIDQKYNPQSTNPQSGIAVNEAINNAINMVTTLLKNAGLM